MARTDHHPPAYRVMADSAIDMLLRSIRRKDPSTRVVVDHVVPHQLIMRDSVAAPPKRK